MDLDRLAEEIVAVCRSLFARGYTASTGGNISHRTSQGFLITATNTSFGSLSTNDLVECKLGGTLVRAGATKPSKELPLHSAIYRNRPDINAVVHLHSPASIAYSCLAEPTAGGNCLPAITPYACLRVGRVPLVPYVRPGSAALAESVGGAASALEVNAVLMQNHGMTAFGNTLEQAVAVAEELELTLQAWLLTRGHARVLTDNEVEELDSSIQPGTQRPRLLSGSRA
jgi:ribulose-5-phosphate 4-epimerase/fuculose-1-phosphate aldolase